MFILQGSGFIILVIVARDHLFTGGGENDFTGLFDVHIVAGTGGTTQKGEPGAV